MTDTLVPELKDRPDVFPADGFLPNGMLSPELRAELRRVDDLRNALSVVGLWVFVIALAATLVGVVCMVLMRFASPAFFKGETLNRTTPTLVPEDTGAPVTD